MPAITLSCGQRAELNFGRSSSELEYFVYFERYGYVPLCSPSALQYNIPLWYSSHGSFEVIANSDPNSRLETSYTYSSIAVKCKEWDYSMQPEQECIRLNMGFTVNPLASQRAPSLTPRPSLCSPSPSAEDHDVKFDDTLLRRKVFSVPLSFSVVFPPGQLVCLAFVGWTTPSFRYMKEWFSAQDEQEPPTSSSHTHNDDFGQDIQVFNKEALPLCSCRTSFMVRLCELLDISTPQLTAPVK